MTMKNLPLTVCIFMEKGYLSIHHHGQAQERACEYLDIYIWHVKLKNTRIDTRLYLLHLSSPFRCPSLTLHKQIEAGGPTS